CSTGATRPGQGEPRPYGRGCCRNRPPPLRAGVAFYGTDEGFEVRDGHRAIAAVTQVHDVPPPAALLDAAPRRRRDLLRRAVAQQLLVHVALEDEVGVLRARRREIMADAKADDVGAATAHVVEIRALLHKENPWRSIG